MLAPLSFSLTSLAIGITCCSSRSDAPILSLLFRHHFGVLETDRPPRNEPLYHADHGNKINSSRCGYVFGHSTAPYSVVPRRKRINEKVVPQPDERAHEAGCPSATVAGDGDVRPLQRVGASCRRARKGVSLASRGIRISQWYEDVQPREREKGT